MERRPQGEKVRGTYELHFEDRFHGHYIWYVPMEVTGPAEERESTVTPSTKEMTEEGKEVNCGGASRGGERGRVLFPSFPSACGALLLCGGIALSRKRRHCHPFEGRARVEHGDVLLSGAAMESESPAASCACGLAC